MRLRLDTTSALPIYAQMIDQIRRAVASGELSPGEQLPTVRQLAVELRINPNTVARVYRELEHLGLIATRQGRGTFVTEARPEVVTHERQAELHRLAQSAMNEAAMLGFTPSELIRAIEANSKQEDNQDA